MTERMDDRALRLKTLGNAVCPPQAYPIFRYIAMIENGSKNPSVDTLWRIANALDMPLSELLRLVEAESAKKNTRNAKELL